MAFLHGQPDELKVKDAETDPGAREKLEAFREKVKQQKHVKYWNGADDLAGKVALSFAKFRGMYPAVGWIRGDTQASTEALEELNNLRKQVAEMERELGAARSSPPPAAAGLAQGGESVAFELPFSMQTRTPKTELYSWDTWSGKLDSVDLGITWDDLFACVGPDLLDEASEQAMQARIGTWLAEAFGDQVRNRVRKAVEKRSDRVTSERKAGVSLSRDDFGTLIVQLRALGLIEKSERNRSVKDKQTYWTLTPYGDAHLTTLRAISQPSGEDASGAEGGTIGDSATSDPEVVPGTDDVGVPF